MPDTKETQNSRLIRSWLTHRLISLRSYISQLPDSVAMVDKLRGPEGDARAARIIDKVMKEIGLEIQTPLADSRNRVRQAVAGVFGPKPE